MNSVNGGFAIRFVVPVAFALMIGCGSGEGPAFPALVSVKGVVKRSGWPVSGGVLKFTPEPDTPEFLANAEVGSDGAFIVSTVRTTDKAGERKSGLSAGKYRVIYLPPLGDQTAGASPKPVELPPISISGERADLVFELPKR